ncbi:MAG TPA: ABC transporter ATP-binding protein [Rhodocyclaceae bacterium]|jgi:NitT/TauT family transport system ATP-binding protein
MSDHAIHSGGIDLRDLRIELGAGKDRFTAVERISANIVPGQFVCLLGPSGCGKSTLLGAVAGHIPVAAGSLTLDGETIKGPHPDRGLVFQHHTLFPWKKVVDNVAFGLKMQGVSLAERRARARELLDLVGLSGFENKYPIQLSGGMQQRVEIARVLINQPRVLLMDEPFGALDAQTRWVMQQLLLDVWARVQTTVLFVTHDIDEAILLGDRILVMSHRPGRIREDLVIDAPRPRGQEWVTSDEFVRLKRHCLELMREEHQRATLSPHLSSQEPAFA